MIRRYTRPQMGELWSEEARLGRWLDVELGLVDVLAERGDVPLAAARRLRERARVDVARMQEIENEVKHDVIAFVSAVTETVGDDGRFLHLGVTSHQVLPGLAALAAVPYLVLFLPFSLVAVVRTAERVRMVEEHAGVTTDEQIRPAAVVGWLLLPVIGGLVLMGRQQGHLNRIWDLAGE